MSKQNTINNEYTQVCKKKNINLTSTMLGMSSNSPKTYTPGASKACLTNSTAAAPLADLANNTNCSNGLDGEGFVSDILVLLLRVKKVNQNIKRAKLLQNALGKI